MKPIAVVVEHDGKRILPVTHELIHLATLLANGIHAPIVLVIPGTDQPDMAAELARLGMRTICLAITGIDGYNSGAYKTALAELFATLSPSHILVAHTATGRDFAPGLAVRLNGTAIAGVNNLLWEDGVPLFSRPIFNGAKNALIQANKTPCIAMVQPSAFLSPEVPASAPLPGPIETMEIKFSDPGIKRLGTRSADKRGDDLERATVIVSAGRGLGSRENLGAVEGFAALFPNAAMGVSRPLVDDGWMPYRFQVGITGARVSPEVYIACGISGSSQHLAGIMGSKTIVSINSDPNAAIFNHSDYCIVADILTFISAFEAIAASVNDPDR
ncbi:EtfA1 [Desulforapulum autotrophicum HRM2]|uniref:EtfA1 n=1 Tax=Desulforapulum autotrophicum (strain ATCC 43914 / DSM 3382 / VKM B-1955 / HRM2) TaxID=177437 RepID=C0QFM3_DESAH|nr:electron transfer flavoprotein subunit alpha/FixB family protein [Desulforapulum autotrophicum]ACN13419.1 EtfA1 [Desulforapulum autotrophicum HRM2]